MSQTNTKIGSGTNMDTYPEESKMSSTIPTKKIALDMSENQDQMSSTLPP